MSAQRIHSDFLEELYQWERTVLPAKNRSEYVVRPVTINEGRYRNRDYPGGNDLLRN